MIALATIYVLGCISADWTGDGAVNHDDVAEASAHLAAGLIDASIWDLTSEAAGWCPDVGTVASLTLPLGVTPALVGGGWLLAAEGMSGSRVATRACHVTGPCCYGRAAIGQAWPCTATGAPHLWVRWTATGPGWVTGLAGGEP